MINDFLHTLSVNETFMLMFITNNIIQIRNGILYYCKHVSLAVNAARYVSNV